jgi:hypothetical protein
MDETEPPAWDVSEARMSLIERLRALHMSIGDEAANALQDAAIQFDVILQISDSGDVTEVAEDAIKAIYE